MESYSKPKSTKKVIKSKGSKEEEKKEVAPKVIKCYSDEKQFIEFLVDYIVETNPGDLYTNLLKVSQDIQKDYGPKNDLNLYRKQFGNLKDCIKKDATKMVFKLDGTCFKF